MNYKSEISIINKCKDIVSNHHAEKSAEAGEYNIYRILNVVNKEVQMCRVLADLLNPEGMHKEGFKYLKEFFKVVLKKEISDEALLDARVYKEYPITNDRRIDIVISYSEGFIPIEVKINAEDQKSQCFDYYQFAASKDENAYIVYLTKTGYKPSDYSLTGESGEKLKDGDVLCISFEKDIIAWLNRIKEIASESMIPMIEQFESAVGYFINNEDEEYKMRLTDNIIENSESLKIAIELERSMGFAKAELMKKLFAEFEKQMIPLCDKYDLEVETKSEWFHYKYEATENFYAHSESTFPGVNYVIKSVELGDDLSLWLRIEIDHRVFASLCIFDYGAKSKTGYEIGDECKVISDELWARLKNRVNFTQDKPEKGWIITWKYLPTGSDDIHDYIETVPDFKKMNDAAIALADTQSREEFVRKSIVKIEDTLLSLIKKQ